MLVICVFESVCMTDSGIPVYEATTEHVPFTAVGPHLIRVLQLHETLNAYRF